MQTFVHHVELAAPLFVLVLVGYVLMRGFAWPQSDVRPPVALRFFGRSAGDAVSPDERLFAAAAGRCAAADRLLSAAA
jgi:hypothetical protein